jgi:polyisoprenoid-binding protein YceI
MLSSLGHNPNIMIRDFTGEADFDPAAPNEAFLRVEVTARSLEVTDDIKSKDRREIESMMNEKVLETGKFPTITFASSTTSVNQLSEGRFQVNMDGSLDLHGVTRKVPLVTHVVLMGTMMRASGEFSLRQSDFGIPLVSVAGGGLKLKDELKFAFDIVARGQD